MEAIKSDFRTPEILSASAELWGDRELVMAAVTLNGVALNYARAVRQGDRECDGGRPAQLAGAGVRLG